MVLAHLTLLQILSISMSMSMIDVKKRRYVSLLQCKSTPKGTRGAKYCGVSPDYFKKYGYDFTVLAYSLNQKASMTFLGILMS